MRFFPQIGILTALPEELAGIKKVMELEDLPAIANDATQYYRGALPGRNRTVHQLVVASASKMGTNAAASASTDLKRSFPSLRYVIFVGVAGGVPRPNDTSKHVRLGDIVVSDRAGVIQTDFGVQADSGFENRSYQPPPGSVFFQALANLESDDKVGRFSWPSFFLTESRRCKLRRPSQSLKKEFRHPKDLDRVPGVPKIVRGRIGAGNAVIRNAAKRDLLAKDLGITAFEMEGSGVADATWLHEIGYFLIRTVMDYGDGNKADKWKQYAADVAAIFLEALLAYLPGPVSLTSGEHAFSEAGASVVRSDHGSVRNSLVTESVTRGAQALQTPFEAWHSSLRLFRRPAMLDRYDSERGPCLDGGYTVFTMDRPDPEIPASPFLPPDTALLTQEYERRLFGREESGPSSISERLYRWRGDASRPPINQVAHILQLLDRSPRTRRAIIAGWDPAQDLLASRNPTTLISAFFHRAHSEISAYVTLRSVDAWMTGLPTLIGWSRFLEFIARELNLEVRTLTLTVYSYHIYEQDYPAMLQLLDRSRV